MNHIRLEKEYLYILMGYACLSLDIVYLSKHPGGEIISKDYSDSSSVPSHFTPRFRSRYSDGEIPQAFLNSRLK